RPGAHIFEEIIMAPTPFTIRIPDATLADLRERLDRVRWPDEIPGAGWQYGTDLTYLRQLVEYWRTQYNWRVHEARLNTFQQSLLLDSRVLRDQQLNERRKQRFASLADVVHELEEPQVNREFLLGNAPMRMQPTA